MHLASIKLRGFKSFPDPVEVRLEPGVAVVVGPNGSGKSNIADAIVWAAGSLSPSELRAEKPDDVLFAGGGARRPADFCEVELVFDNNDAADPNLPAELSIARRLHRGGEGQYLLGRRPVRRTDLVELLADLGLGAGMHSIIGQGKVEEVLASSPARRRELVEEAAGLGRFKRQRHRAELKLARVAVQVERARDVEEEVRKRLRPLALQATAAERAERLAGEIGSLRARLAALDLEATRARLGEADERRAAAALGQRLTQERLDSVLEERGRAEEDLADTAGRREAVTAALYRLRSAHERLNMRLEAVGALVASLPAGSDEMASALELRRAAVEAADSARKAAAHEAELEERTGLARARLAGLDLALTEREGLAPAARQLVEGGERLAIDALHVEPGRERAVAAALGPRASALLVDDVRAGFGLLERAAAAGLGSVRILVGRDPHELVEEFPVVSANELLSSAVPAVTVEGYGYDPQIGELWFSGTAVEAVLLELEARRRSLARDVAELEVALADAAREAGESAARAHEARGALAALPPVARVDPATAARLRDLGGRLARALETAAAVAERLEAPLRARSDAGGHRTEELAKRLRTLGAQEADLRREAADLAQRVSAIDVERARLEAEADEARRRLEAAGAEPAEGDDRDALAERLERLERRRESLGRVNPLAKEEYEAEKGRLDELSTQRADLEASLVELERLRADLDETVERRFTETFDAVQRHFAETAAALFPGGEGKLRLTDAGADEDGVEPGVEVELRPAGKRVTRLSLLSGGEKALGAIAFLFALFLARPCPFYLLDEVEAALDDTNIARFVDLLRSYADRAQFLVITHQKRTMEAADTLYGVTMGADGVSEIVSRRLPREAPFAVAS